MPTRKAIPHRWLITALTKKPRLHVQGPRVHTVSAAPPLPYLGPFASTPARILALRLVQMGYALRGEVPFGGGNQMRGGMIADIYIVNLRTVVRVQGEYWHRQPGAQARDDAQAIWLRARRLRVVDVWTWDILHRLDWVIREQIGASAM